MPTEQEAPGVNISMQDAATDFGTFHLDSACEPDPERLTRDATASTNTLATAAATRKCGNPDWPLTCTVGNLSTALVTERGLACRFGATSPCGSGASSESSLRALAAFFSGLILKAAMLPPVCDATLVISCTFAQAQPRQYHRRPGIVCVCACVLCVQEYLRMVRSGTARLRAPRFAPPHKEDGSCEFI